MLTSMRAMSAVVLALLALLAPLDVDAQRLVESDDVEPRGDVEPQQASDLPCTDDALADAASALVRSADEHPPTGIDLLDAARDAGSDAPAVHALVIAANERARLVPWIAALAARLRAPIACGEAGTEGRTFVLAAARAGTLTPDPAAARRYEITLAPGFRDPVIYVEDGAGRVARIALEGLRAELPDDLEPPLRIQLVARGPDGPRPIAERTLGQISRRTATPSRDPGAPALDVRIDALRERAGVSPLRPHRVLAEAARAHAADVCRARRAAHELEPGRDPRARARSRGIDARHVGEVVARAGDVDAAFDALSRSVSHRAALIDRRFTDAGAGIAIDERGDACVVVMLAAWPRWIAGRGSLP
jgi:hypothetical protein